MSFPCLAGGVRKTRGNANEKNVRPPSIVILASFLEGCDKMAVEDVVMMRNDYVRRDMDWWYTTYR